MGWKDSNPKLAETVRRARSAAIAMAITTMHKRYADPDLRLDDVVFGTGYNRYPFTRIFAKRCGLSPMRYLCQIRMNRAAELLISTKMTIREVAKAVGYKSVGTWSTKFHKVIGVSPSVYRAWGLPLSEYRTWFTVSTCEKKKCDEECPH